jgi:hypothetical protein
MPSILLDIFTGSISFNPHNSPEKDLSSSVEEKARS